MLTALHRLRNLSAPRVLVPIFLLLTMVPAANADMIWFQRSEGEWFLRNNLNLVPLDSMSFFNEHFTDATSTPGFSESYSGPGATVLPVDIRFDLAQPADAVAVRHNISDLLFSGGAGAVFDLTYEFFDAAGNSLGKLGTSTGASPVLTDMTEIEVPRIVVDSGPVDPQICVRGNSRRSGCYAITSDAGINGTADDDLPMPSPYFNSFEYAFASLDQPIASLAIIGDIETLFFVEQTNITLSGKSGSYDLQGFADASGFPLDDPAAVPLPAAAWFFASALAAFFGLGRRFRRAS